MSPQRRAVLPLLLLACTSGTTMDEDASGRAAGGHAGTAPDETPGGAAGSPGDDEPLPEGGQGGAEPGAEAGQGGAFAPSGGSGGEGGGPVAGTGGTTPASVPMSELYLAPDREGDFDFSDKTWKYPPEALSMLGVPSGKVTSHSYASKSVYAGRIFKYWVYVPAQYAAGKPAALMLWQDGQKGVSTLRVPIVFNNLIHLGRVPVTINIFVDPSSEASRSEEYDSVDDRYVRFLVSELIPEALRVNGLEVTSDPDGHAIGGHSSGGAAAFTAAWQRPDYFRRVATGMGSFVALRGADRYPGLVRDTRPVKPIRVSLLSGDGDLAPFGGWLPANRRMAAALKEAGYHYRFIEADEVTHAEKYFAMTMAYDLEFIWHGYQPKP